MRIGILSDRIPPESPGGAGRVTWSLACGLRAAGHDVHVIAATEGASFEATRDGLPTYHLHSRYPPRFRAYISLYNPQTLGGLWRILADIRPDVVHAHNIHTHLSYGALIVARRLGIPTVVHAHDVRPFAYNRLSHYVDPARCGVESPDAYRLPRFYNLRQMRFRYNPLRNAIIRYMLGHFADARVAVSEALREALEANGLPPFRAVHNGIDPATMAAPAGTVEGLRERLGLAGRRVILAAGRISRDKGRWQLLDALSQVVEQVPEALLLILSQAPAEKQGLDRSRYAHLRDHVRVGGWLAGEDLVAAFHVADVVTAPSIVLDSFPTVNLEAMAAGKPLVSTCHGGSPEIVIDGETGYIINPYDTDQFADRLARLLLDEDLRRRMGHAGRSRVEKAFSLAGQVAAMEAIYHEVGA